jgi:1,4-alpha-glucan branching enzyme
MGANRLARISAEDLYLFNEGTHYRLYERLGAHPAVDESGHPGTSFAVWAPDALAVSVIGDWNGWSKGADPLGARGHSGVWEGFIAGLGPGTRYKYHIVSRYRGYRVDKADPFAFHAETPPRQASIVWPLVYSWGDGDWLAGRAARHSLAAPMSIYEVHLGSWRRVPEEGNRSLSYRELAPLLAEHVRRLGFTHVELLPVMEHPFFGSWGYQGTGFFAPTSRYGTPQDLMYMIDYLHQQGIGVVLDWVPSHFPTDEHGLAFFDGTHLYEHADPRKGVQPDWGSLIFNYGRPEVRSFLISSALFWLDKYHADGLRVDAVASMLYLDYSRREGEWLPNRHGGRENLEAIDFLRAFNSAVFQEFPDVQTIAEESTAWPMVSRPTYLGGLGFGLKWDMGWMHDTLDYLAMDPIFRKFHQNELTFRGIYAWTENFVLPLSHDEVVHGKGSLLAKMPGDAWQKFANLRLLFAWMFAQPGKKLLFMGSELAGWREWNHDGSLDWHLLGEPAHAGIARWIEDLNRLHREQAAMHELDCHPSGFAWIDGSDSENSVLSFARHAGPGGEASGTGGPVVAVFNFTPVLRTNYRIGVPGGGFWRELLNSDGPDYGGSGQGNFGGVEASPVPLHGRSHSLTLTLPPLGALFLQASREPTASERAEGAAEPAGAAHAEPPAQAPETIERPPGVAAGAPTASERAEGAMGEGEAAQGEPAPGGARGAGEAGAAGDGAEAVGPTAGEEGPGSS